MSLRGLVIIIQLALQYSIFGLWSCEDTETRQSGWR